MEATAAVQTICGGGLVSVGWEGRNGGGGTYNVWRCHVVEEGRDALLPGRHHGDVEDPLAPVERLVKGQVAHVGPDALFQDLDVQEIAFLPEPLHSPAQRAQPRPHRLADPPVVAGRVGALAGERREVDAVARQDPQEILFRVDADQCRHHGARCRPYDDAGEQASQEQGLDDAEMAEAKDGAALQDQGAPAEALFRVVDEIELVLGRDGGGRHAAGARAVSEVGGGAGVRLVNVLLHSAILRADLAVLPFLGQRSLLAVDGRRQRGQVENTFHVLGNVFLDQQLGAGEAAIKKLPAGNIAQIPNKPRTQRVDEPVDIPALAHGPDEAHPLVDQAIVIVAALRVLAPHVETEDDIEVLASLGPFFIVGGRIKNIPPCIDGSGAEEDRPGSLPGTRCSSVTEVE